MAFSSAYRPGFSTYPEGATLKEVQAVLARHGSPGWISAEGTNVSPTSMPGEPNMETYLGRMFNHGAVMVNVFAWGIGGGAMRNNFFRQATENPEALASYAKFLRHGTLVESAPSGFSSEAFQTKMRRIQAELPGWVQKSGQQASVMPLTRKLEALIKGKRWQEVDKVADELLALMKGDFRVEAKPEALPLMKRLPLKIHRIQKELPAWIEKADAARKGKATGLMQKLQDQINAKNFEEVEKTADSLLKMMVNEPAAAQDIPEEARTKPEAAPLGNACLPRFIESRRNSPHGSRRVATGTRAAGLMQKLDGQLKAKNFEEAEKDRGFHPDDDGREGRATGLLAQTMHKRISGKVERVKAGLNKWEASGHDPSAIVKTMQEKVGRSTPSLLEAKSRADRVLEQLGQPKAAAQGIPEEARRQLRHELGGSFVVFRDKVQEELKLTREKKEKLEQHLQKRVQTPAVFPEVRRSEAGGAREELGPYRPKTRERLDSLLKETLSEGQRPRARARAAKGGASGWGHLERPASHGRATKAIHGADAAGDERDLSAAGRGAEERQSQEDPAQGDQDTRPPRSHDGGPAHGCPENAVEGNAGQADGPLD